MLIVTTSKQYAFVSIKPQLSLNSSEYVRGYASPAYWAAADAGAGAGAGERGDSTTTTRKPSAAVAAVAAGAGAGALKQKRTVDRPQLLQQQTGSGSGSAPPRAVPSKTVVVRYLRVNEVLLKVSYDGKPKSFNEVKLVLDESTYTDFHGGFTGLPLSPPAVIGRLHRKLSDRIAHVCVYRYTVCEARLFTSSE